MDEEQKRRQRERREDRERERRQDKSLLMDTKLLSRLARIMGGDEPLAAAADVGVAGIASACHADDVVARQVADLLGAFFPIAGGAPLAADASRDAVLAFVDERLRSPAFYDRMRSRLGALNDKYSIAKLCGSHKRTWTTLPLNEMPAQMQPVRACDVLVFWRQSIQLFRFRLSAPQIFRDQSAAGIKVLCRMGVWLNAALYCAGAMLKNSVSVDSQIVGPRYLVRAAAKTALRAWTNTFADNIFKDGTLRLDDDQQDDLFVDVHNFVVDQQESPRLPRDASNDLLDFGDNAAAKLMRSPASGKASMREFAGVTNGATGFAVCLDSALTTQPTVSNRFVEIVDGQMIVILRRLPNSLYAFARDTLSLVGIVDEATSIVVSSILLRAVFKDNVDVARQAVTLADRVTNDDELFALIALGVRASVIRSRNPKLKALVRICFGFSLLCANRGRARAAPGVDVQDARERAH